ncbi:hypothetical protein COLO4_37270 [Corchorus olitorius]|uniref:Transferring glycosyl group transferase n=1 Tax=Corchorus olitorius TaxID=93759 RepID=A0A1R3G2Q7_9ROSI|nr:hypothetical protein COLO4_37270 [Corchorus olitorius]
MACAVKPILIFLISIISFHVSLIASDPTPAAWPLQFHSILFMNNSGTLQHVDLWYDWPNGRNFNIIQNQLGKLTYDLEWDNGTSYIYTTLDSNKECRVLHFPVGILRPDWLDGANYLGQEEKDGFLCNVWEKVDFIWYYEDVVTKRPVYWAFYTGYTAHVMTFEVGAVLEDSHWQAPLYCFKEAQEKGKPLPLIEEFLVFSSFFSIGNERFGNFGPCQGIIAKCQYDIK